MHAGAGGRQQLPHLLQHVVVNELDQLLLGYVLWRGGVDLADVQLQVLDGIACGAAGHRAEVDRLSAVTCWARS